MIPARRVNEQGELPRKRLQKLDQLIGRWQIRGFVRAGIMIKFDPETANDIHVIVCPTPTGDTRRMAQAHADIRTGVLRVLGEKGRGLVTVRTAKPAGAKLSRARQPGDHKPGVIGRIGEEAF